MLGLLVDWLVDFFFSGLVCVCVCVCVVVFSLIVDELITTRGSWFSKLREYVREQEEEESESREIPTLRD